MNRTCAALIWLVTGFAATGGTLKNVRGTVRVVSAEQGWYGLVPDRDPGTRYAPEPPLPEAFRKDGLRVIFSGRLGKVPDGERRWGTPLVVTRIEPEKSRK